MKWAKDEFTGKRFGKYEVLCRLAVGGMAEIFLAFPRAGDLIGQPVVLKRILAEQREDEHALQMLLDEAKLTATLNHLNVARVIDLEVDGEEVLLVIEFISGANMEELVAAYTEKDEIVPLGLALSVIREAAQGLAHAHGHVDAKGRPTPIVHRDVTPRNIMVTFDGVTKMLDFGIARAMGTQRRTVAGMVRGTTAYMSPEQAIGKDVNPQSDIFSLGVIFHELLTGQRLFMRPNPGEEMAAVYEGEIPLPSKVNRRVPKPLDAVVMRALERPREKRYQSGLELIRDISLTAGSTAWASDRSGEAVREKFASRERDIERLILAIPTRELGIVPRPSIPEARTLIAQLSSKTGLPLAPGMTDERQSFKTLQQAGPVERAPVSMRSTDPNQRVPVGEEESRPHRRISQIPMALGEAEASVEETRIVPVSSPPQSTTGPALDPELLTEDAPIRGARKKTRVAEAAPSSTGAFIAVGVIAIALGVVGGVVISKQVSTGDTTTFGRLSIRADRQAEVRLGTQSLGETPVSELLLPVGKHHLVLKEADGKTRSVDVVVNAEKETRLELRLDALPAQP